MKHGPLLQLTTAASVCQTRLSSAQSRFPSAAHNGNKQSLYNALNSVLTKALRVTVHPKTTRSEIVLGTLISCYMEPGRKRGIHVGFRWQSQKERDH
jgi:hypothetical protein